MNPLSLNPLVLIAALGIAGAVGFGSGWQVNGWRKDAAIAAVERDQAKGQATQAQATLADLIVAAHNIRTAADGYTADAAALGTKLDALRKEFKNAKPLPVDCRPDDFRVRHLGKAVDAANQAAAGQ